MAIYTNQATLSYNNVVVNSNVATGEILEVLNIQKSTLNSFYDNNSIITYVLTLNNTGSNVLTDLTVSDNLGAYTYNTLSLVPLTYVDGSIRYLVNGVLQTPPTVVAGPPFEITGVTVPANGNVAILYQATPNTFAPVSDGSSITNTATVSGGGLTTAVASTTSLPAATEPVLSIIKSISPIPVVENGTVTYTFVISNSSTSPATATENVILTDTFNPVLTNLSASFNGVTWTEGTNYTYDTTTGLFTSLNGSITVPAATVVQDTTTGAYTVTPGTSTLVITGTI
mgnify:CR=1 FL=1